MKVTIEFDTKEEETEFLDSVTKYRFVSKEEIENALSSYMYEVIRSPILRSVVRREKQKEEALKRVEKRDEMLARRKQLKEKK